ncbi:hypothetical protein [Salinimonas chungwhensis]|uniref:hypothetical protein n=1 Tax=Salinimonas chungwhensis TaxID=265425 RepID=UPI00037349B6|nr:hypothetical protein [Salinimonas chungwhensis]
MKLLKPKRQPQPASRFQQYLQSQPVFNWFERYEQPAPVGEFKTNERANWIAKRVGE